MDFPLISIGKDAPDSFLFFEELPERELKRSVFALYADDFQQAQKWCGHLFERVAGVILTREEEFLCHQIGPCLWHMGFPDRMEPSVKDMVTAYLKMADSLLIHQREARSFELARQAKDDFLTSISHQMRTALNASLGLVDLLYETELTPEQAKYLKVVETAGKTLLEVAGNLMDMAPSTTTLDMEALEPQEPVGIPKDEEHSFPQEGREVRPLRILCAEDSENNRMLFSAYMKATPHQVDMAEDGRQAVKKFQEGEYDVIFMDLEMPVMNGYDASQSIRDLEQEQGLSPTPIIALTADAFQEAAARSKSVGCTLHLTKPVKKSQLLQLLDGFFS